MYGEMHFIFWHIFSSQFTYPDDFLFLLILFKNERFPRLLQVKAYLNSRVEDLKPFCIVWRGKMSERNQTGKEKQMREEFAEHFYLISFTNEYCCYEKTHVFDKWFHLSLKFAFKRFNKWMKYRSCKKYCITNMPFVSREFFMTDWVCFACFGIRLWRHLLLTLFFYSQYIVIYLNYQWIRYQKLTTIILELSKKFLK